MHAFLSRICSDWKKGENTYLNKPNTFSDLRLGNKMFSVLLCLFQYTRWQQTHTVVFTLSLTCLKLRQSSSLNNQMLNFSLYDSLQSPFHS